MSRTVGKSAVVALVTGASQGLGRETALELGRQGYTIVVNYLNAEEEARKVAGMVSGNSLAIRADVGKAGQVHAMALRIEETFGRLDVIVNNAGITRDSLVLKQTVDDWDAVIETNLKGPFLVMRELAPLMIRSGGGHILNIASHSGLRGKAGQPAYSASKAALIGLTLSAALEFAEYNISVNAIVPGYMKTGMGLKAAKALKKAEEESLLHQLTEPVDVAASIVQLLQCRYISGQVISLDSRIE